jgi:hypothetical protein
VMLSRIFFPPIVVTTVIGPTMCPVKGRRF